MSLLENTVQHIDINQASQEEKRIFWRGIGLHSGKSADISVYPGKNTENKITFISKHWTSPIDATWNNVVDTTLCTVLGNANGNRVSTVEHILSALYSCGIYNAIVDIDGGGPVVEMPILDGSCQMFVDGISAWKNNHATQELLSKAQDHMPVLRVRKEIKVGDDQRWMKLVPFDGYAVDLTLDFTAHDYNRQQRYYDVDHGDYQNDIAPCRTFCFYEDIKFMQKHNLALGGSLDNAVVIQDGNVLNPSGLMFDDECVRHKILDIIGDLSLSGFRLQALVSGFCSGHALNIELLKALFSDEKHYDIIKP
jgi:UDP-3-O-[3-hydroxymyristoyl] N-acetylglucosamine deacetylase